MVYFSESFQIIISNPDQKVNPQMSKQIARIGVLHLLSWLASWRLSPSTTIIGITGSVGKTTTKAAAAKILGTHYRVHASQQSFNSEFGVPLTILEQKSGYSSVLAWLGILLRSLRKSLTPLKVEKLILELGADAPDDLSKLLKLAQPSIGVVTAIAPVHLAAGQFATVEAIAEEKAKLVASLPTTGTAILNADDPLVAAMVTPAHRLTFGITQPADLTASEVTESLTSLTARLNYQHETAELKVPILGTHNLCSLLAAIGIGLSSSLTLTECVAALAEFRLPPGRLNLLKGVNGSHLIDGSYNANPASVRAALTTLGKLKTTGRKIVVLGQMNELGANSGRLHHALGAEVATVADEVIGVHGEAWGCVATAKAAGKPARFFPTAEAAATYLAPLLRGNDLVLLKGSQNNVRLEKCVAKLLADPADQKLLCRQDAYWQTH